MKKNKATAATATAEPVETVPAQPGANALASRLISQYRRVEATKGQFVRAATAFGISMMRAEADRSTAVERAKGQKRGKNGRFGGEFEDWLAEHCPEINYKTAMSYRALAQKMIALMGGETPEVMAALAAPSDMEISYEVGGYGSGGRGAPALPGDGIGGRGAPTLPGAAAPGDAATVPAEVIKAREAIFADATSRRKLEQMYFDFARRKEKAEDGGKVAKVKLAAVGGKVRSAADAAAILWGGAMAVFETKRGAFFSAARDLNVNLAAQWLEELKMLVEVLERRLKG